MKERDYYITPKSNAVMRFLWKAAGGDKYLLEQATYSDQVKYMCLGGIVFATGAMAGLAGGYAFYTIFSPRGSALDTVKQKFAELNQEAVQQMTNDAIASFHTQEILVPILSIVFGIIWGLIIFNIDRFIVTSTGKGDGTEKITWEEFKGAIPRILMGAIIAITISKPVEIRMFKTEIDIKLHEKQIEQQQSYKIKTDSLFSSEIKNKEIEINKFEIQLQNNILRHADLEKQYIDEARIVTVGPRALAVKAQMEVVENEIKDLQKNPEYVRLKKEKDEIEKRREKALDESQQVANNLDGLLERIKISGEVAGGVISLFITLLFMAIELTPVFFKLMLTKTPYDYLAENRDDLIKAENGIEVRYDFYKDKKGQERHLNINHEAERMIYEKIKLTDIQKELTDYAIEKYKQKEKKKIDENLDGYIKGLNSNIEPQEDDNPNVDKMDESNKTQKTDDNNKNTDELPLENNDDLKNKNIATKLDDEKPISNNDIDKNINKDESGIT